MATWTHIRTLTGLSPSWVCLDGSTIYFISDDSADNDIYQYTTTTDTLVKIAENTSITDWHEARGMTFFDGNLYALVDYKTPTQNLQVIQYDGTPDSWTSVLTMAREIEFYTGLFSNDDEMVVFGIEFDADIEETWYTTNGTSWSAGSWGNTPNVSSGFGTFTWGYQTEWPLGFYVVMCQGTGTSCTSYDMLKWNTGTKTWDTLQTGISYEHWATSQDSANQIFWVADQTSYTSNFTSITTPSATKEVFTLIGTQEAGVALDNLDQDLYTFNGSTWDVLDTTSDDHNLTDSEQMTFWVMENSDTFLCAISGDHSNEYVVMKRETILSASIYDLTHSGVGIPGSII